METIEQLLAAYERLEPVAPLRDPALPAPLPWAVHQEPYHGLWLVYDAAGVGVACFDHEVDARLVVALVNGEE